MRLSKTPKIGIRLPRFDALVVPGVNTLGPRSVSTLLKIALDVAYVLLALITGVMIICFVISAFIPIENVDVTVSDDAGGKAMPLTRTLIVFALGCLTAYFGSFLLIMGHLRKIFRTLTIGDPFQPANVRRLRWIGLILAVVTGGVWLVQGMVASRLAPGIMDPQGLGELLTPIFSVLVVFVLAEVFREGARLRRESELTI
jgi:hypothetical protein